MKKYILALILILFNLGVGSHLFAQCAGTGIAGNTYVVIKQSLFSGTYNVTNLLAYAPFNTTFTGSGIVSGGGTSGLGLKILVINDNLTIDKNFTFSNTIIEMGDNASLKVLPGVKLKINNSIIRSAGCGKLWNTIDATDVDAVPFTGGVLCTTCTTCNGQHYKYTGAAVEIINSVIQDAVTAVQLSIYSNSNFSTNNCIITGNTFQKNETSIAIKYVDKIPNRPVSFNYNAFSNINNRCDAVTFSINSNIFQYSPTLPHIGSNTINLINTGISLYHTAFTFTGYGFYNNTFQFLQTGINSFASKWTGTNNIFRTISPSVANSAKDYDGVAIFINDAVPIDPNSNLPYLSQGNYVGWGSLFNNMVSSTAEISISSFQDCYRGIYQNMAGFTGRYYDIGSGTLGGYFPIGNELLVHDNTFNNEFVPLNTAIEASNGVFSNVQIWNNILKRVNIGIVINNNVYPLINVYQNKINCNITTYPYTFGGAKCNKAIVANGNVTGFTAATWNTFFVPKPIGPGQQTIRNESIGISLNTISSSKAITCNNNNLSASAFSVGDNQISVIGSLTLNYPVIY